MERRMERRRRKDSQVERRAGGGGVCERERMRIGEDQGGGVFDTHRHTHSPTHTGTHERGEGGGAQHSKCPANVR